METPKRGDILAAAKAAHIPQPDAVADQCINAAKEGKDWRRILLFAALASLTNGPDGGDAC